MVEFALVLPILVMLIIGAVQFGIVFKDWINVNDTARVAARAAVVWRFNSQPDPCAAATAACGLGWRRRDARELQQGSVGKVRDPDGRTRLECEPAADPGLRGRTADKRRHRKARMRVFTIVRDERGQSLVFAVLAVGALISIVALVVSAGDWMRIKQRAQSVADAAALAGAQELPDGAAAKAEVVDSASLNNWPVDSNSLQYSVSPEAIAVRTQEQVQGVFAPLAGVFNLTISTGAHARVGAPATIANVAPVGLKCNASCSEWNGTDTFTFNRTTPGTNSLAPLSLPGVKNQNDFRAFVQCDVQNPSQGTCNQANATAPLSYQPLALGGQRPGPSPEVGSPGRGGAGPSHPRFRQLLLRQRL